MTLIMGKETDCRSGRRYFVIPGVEDSQNIELKNGRNIGKDGGVRGNMA
jgi:hypothetical protein